MTDAEAFLAAIRAQPDELAPRLVFADWLDERGDPLGEFIRLSVAWEELSSSERAGWPSAARMRQLRYCFEEWWVNPLRDLGACDTVVRRGFVEEITIDLDVFLRRANELFALAPLRTVVVRHRQGPLTPIYLQQLAMLGPVRRLACLDLAGFPISDQCARRLAGRAASLRKLGRLRLLGSGLRHETVETLREKFGAALELLAAT